MKDNKIWTVCFLLLAVSLIFTPELALAQIGGIGGNDLAGKMNGLTNSVITVILPAVSVLGLVYSAILAATGDQAAKSRMVLIAFASIVGFLAPIIIGWLKSASGVGGF